MERKVQTYEILIGKSVKLKAYTFYNDYTGHYGEIATVENEGMFGTLPIPIRWADNTTSSVNRNNLIIIENDWDM